MIEAIGSSSSYQFQPQVRTETALTDDQKETVADILAKYDSSNMTEEETRAMFDELRSANVGPSKEMKEILETAGFELPEPPEGGQPPKPEGTESTGTQPPQYALELLEKIKTGEISEDEVSSLLENLKKDDQLTTGVYVNQKA